MIGSTWRRTVIDGLLSVYGFANRRGLLDAPLAREAFARSYFLYKRAVEDPFAGLLRRRPELLQGGHVLDVGANIGYTAALFATGLTGGYRVYAFEPEPKNFAQLERTVARLQLAGRVEPVHAAVGATDGTVQLWRNEAHHGNHRIATPDLRKRTADPASLTVPLVSLDRFAEERGIAAAVRFVKIDVQGYEPEVLAGMQGLLAANRGLAVAIEFMPQAIADLGFEPDALLETLTRAGLRLHALGRDGSVTPFDRSRPAPHLAERGYVDLLCWRDAP